MANKISRIKKNLISDAEIMENIKNALNRNTVMIADELGVNESVINAILSRRNNISKNVKELLLLAYPINKNYIEFGYGDVLRDENLSLVIKNQEKMDKKIDMLTETMKELLKIIKAK